MTDKTNGGFDVLEVKPVSCTKMLGSQSSPGANRIKAFIAHSGRGGLGCAGAEGEHDPLRLFEVNSFASFCSCSGSVQSALAPSASFMPRLHRSQRNQFPGTLGFLPARELRRLYCYGRARGGFSCPFLERKVG